MPHEDDKELEITVVEEEKAEQMKRACRSRPGMGRTGRGRT